MSRGTIHEDHHRHRHCAFIVDERLRMQQAGILVIGADRWATRTPAVGARRRSDPARRSQAAELCSSAGGFVGWCRTYHTA